LHSTAHISHAAALPENGSPFLRIRKRIGLFPGKKTNRGIWFAWSKGKGVFEKLHQKAQKVYCGVGPGKSNDAQAWQRQSIT